MPLWIWSPGMSILLHSSQFIIQVLYYSSVIHYTCESFMYFIYSLMTSKKLAVLIKNCPSPSWQGCFPHYISCKNLFDNKWKIYSGTNLKTKWPIEARNISKFRKNNNVECWWMLHTLSMKSLILKSLIKYLLSFWYNLSTTMNIYSCWLQILILNLTKGSLIPYFAAIHFCYGANQ